MLYKPGKMIQMMEIWRDFSRLGGSWGTLVSNIFKKIMSGDFHQDP